MSEEAEAEPAPRDHRSDDVTMTSSPRDPQVVQAKEEIADDGGENGLEASEPGTGNNHDGMELPVYE